MILSCLANGNSYLKRELTASSGLAVAARTRWFRGVEKYIDDVYETAQEKEKRRKVTINYFDRIFYIIVFEVRSRDQSIESVDYIPYMRPNWF